MVIYPVTRALVTFHLEAFNDILNIKSFDNVLNTIKALHAVRNILH